MSWSYGISFAEISPMSAPLPLAGDLYESMEAAAHMGYQALEFHTREDFPFDYDRIAALREEKQVGICMLVTGRLFTQGGLSLLDPDPQKAEGCAKGLMRYIDCAKALGAGIVLGWAKGAASKDEPREAALERLARRLGPLNAYGKERGVPIALEVINHYETNLLNTAAETVGFLEAYRLDNCFVHLDTYHMNIEEADPYAAIRRCGARLGYFHVADNSRRYPGSGQLDFRRLLRTLQETGYSGWITVECIPDPDRGTAAQKAIRYLRGCEATL